jgi:hypothetical protein
MLKKLDIFVDLKRKLQFIIGMNLLIMFVFILITLFNDSFFKEVMYKNNYIFIHVLLTCILSFSVFILVPIIYKLERYKKDI